jgi:hypothetical protein
MWKWGVQLMLSAYTRRWTFLSIFLRFVDWNWSSTKAGALASILNHAVMKSNKVEHGSLTLRSTSLSVTPCPKPRPLFALQAALVWLGPWSSCAGTLICTFICWWNLELDPFWSRGWEPWWHNAFINNRERSSIWHTCFVSPCDVMSSAVLWCHALGLPKLQEELLFFINYSISGILW